MRSFGTVHVVRLQLSTGDTGLLGTADGVIDGMLDGFFDGWSDGTSEGAMLGALEGWHVSKSSADQVIDIFRVHVMARFTASTGPKV